jgi:hypothetical protein
MATHEQEPLLIFFDYEHLREDLREVSKPFRVLANVLVDMLPRNTERTMAIRYLLQSKDCAVRAMVWT